MEKFSVALCLLLGISVILAVSVASVEKGLPGDIVATENLALLVATGKGYCKHTATPCSGNAELICSNMLFGENALCNTSAAVGSCPVSSPNNQECIDAESPYTCLQQTAKCCDLPTCRLGSDGICRTNGPSQAVGGRTVC